MVGEIKRNYLSGTKLVTEKRPTWRDSGINEVVNSVAGAVEAGNNYFEREKQLVWKRLNLEAANLQTEELNAIKTAKSVEEIPGIVKNFQKKLKENMRGQKWGKEWMENLGSGFLSYNKQDVQNAFRAKEKELAGISLNETLKAYADQIAAAPEDEAAFFSADADKLIDADTYLTPTEKQKAKENFAKLSVNGMVNNNPEVAKKALSDPGRFPNLTDIERREYLQKADNLLVAKEKDRLAAEEREKKLKKSAADLNITRAKYLFVRGKMSAEEALKVADDNYMDSPETALTLRERVLGKPGEEKSDQNVLKELEEKIKNKTATKEEIVFANIDKTLNDEDYKELLAQGKELGLWAKDGEDEDAKYRANLSLVDEGRDAVNQAFVRGDFDKTTRDALLKDIDEKEKNATVAWEADLKLRMSAGEVVDVDKELANSPYAARKKEDEVLAKVGLLSDDLQERYFILRENDVNAEEAYAEVMRENGDLATLVDDDIPFQYQTGEALTERENGYKIADDNETVETVVIPDNALPEFKTRADLRNWLIGKFNEIGNVTIKSTGANVEFNKTGAQRAIKNARQKKNNIAYPEIEKVVSGAKYSGFREADERHQNVKGQDVYHSGVVYKGVPYSVEFYVDVPLSGNTGDNFAGNKIREIKIAPTETRVTSENQNRPANNLSDAISNVSLAVLRGKVKPARYDAETGVLYQTGAEFGWPDYREIEASEPYIGYKKYAEDVRNMIQDDVKYADLQMSVNRVGGISSYINGETKDGEAFRIRISDHDTNYDTADISFYYSSDKNKFIERWQKFLKQSEQRKAKAEKQEAARKEYIAENLPKEYINYYRQYGLKALKKAVNERQLPPFKFTFNDEQQKIYGTRGISWRDVKQFIEENSEPVNDTLYQTGEPLTEYAYEKGGRAYNKRLF